MFLWAFLPLAYFFRLAVLPLAGYFFWLALLQNRRKPTILDGVQDFMLLSCGLFGLFSLGLGRLVIPIGVMSFWGWFVWFFWTAFYFSAAYLFARQLSQRIVIYHCPHRIFISGILEHVQKLDQRSRLEGNVLFLPDFDIQCTIIGTNGDWGQYLVLNATSHDQDVLKWQLLKQSTIAACSSVHNPPNKKTILRGIGFFILLLLTIIGFVLYDVPVLIDVFYDYW
ncbi:MAG: hypothetical protein LBI18_13705 [Planctomycetaceae bacterium]|jgi:hypothetical protein|nr:hypothetical protein [Planctomycetaceae bacterium]